MHPSTNAPPSTVLKLIQKSTPAFLQMRDGTKGMNCLHYALLHKVPEDILTAALDQGEPSLVLDQNNHGNNALHYAIKNKVSKKIWTVSFSLEKKDSSRRKIPLVKTLYT